MRGILVLIIIIVLLFSWGANAIAATSGFGARAAAMGGAYTAVADDGTAPYWNPAGITLIKVLTFTPCIGVQGDIEIELLSAGVVAEGTLMAGVSSKYVGVNFLNDVGGYGAGDPIAWKGLLSDFKYSVLTLGFPIDEGFSLGLNVKEVEGNLKLFDYITPDLTTIYGKIEGATYDLGVLYQFNRTLRLGLMGRNIAGDTSLTHIKYQFNNDTPILLSGRDYNLPQSYIFGIAYFPNRDALIAFDWETINEPENQNTNRTLLHLGFEQTAFGKVLALRGGFIAETDKFLGISTGIGFKLGPVLIDSAAAMMGKEPLLCSITAGVKF